MIPVELSAGRSSIGIRIMHGWSKAWLNSTFLLIIIHKFLWLLEEASFFPLLRSENLTPFLRHLDNVTCHFEAGSTIWNPGFGHKCKRLWDFQHCRSYFCPCLKELPQSNLLFVPLKAFQLTINISTFRVLYN